MTHTHEAAGGTRFLHNGDYSGDISLVVPEAAARLHDAEGGYPACWEVRVPFAAGALLPAPAPHRASRAGHRRRVRA
jgi:hypothetical protein